MPTETSARVLATLCLFALLTPELALARHGHSDRVNRSSLDEDIVESLPLPILFGLTTAEVRPDFGEPRGGGTRSHEGQDFFAPLGAPIVSPTKAIVIRTGTGDSAGKYVYTANPGGETFRYMHLDTIADIDPGDRLDPGDFIGTVGDTGNAPSGVYHLHLEIRDEDNEATDPYPRFSDTFTLKEQAAALTNIFDRIRNDSEYADFLVATYGTELAQVARTETVPRVLRRALEEAGVLASAEKEAALAELIATIPRVLVASVGEGSQGPAVSLLQLYLIYTERGPERDRLAAAGPTGYYGPTTAAVVTALQGRLGIAKTGTYDEKTRAAILADE